MIECGVATALGMGLLLFYWNDLFPPMVIGRRTFPSMTGESYVWSAPFVGLAALLAWSSMRRLRGGARLIAIVPAIPVAIAAWIWLRAFFYWVL